MKDCREEWYDAEQKVSVTIVDVSSAALALARGHLCGPTSAHFLTEALAAAALLGSELTEKDETLVIQMACKGPLGGYNVECTSAGTLRGYTVKKTLEEFDGLNCTDERKVLGERQFQVTRSLPGKILSQGISNSLDGYLAGSLQRRAIIRLEAAVNDEVEILVAKGVMVEALPDSKVEVSSLIPEKLNLASRTIINRLGLKKAELKRTTPLSFACRCSAQRAADIIGAMSEKERLAMPPTIDVTCHMCGKTYTIATR